jgi:hypothetical protein
VLLGRMRSWEYSPRSSLLLVGWWKRKKMITQYWVEWKGYLEDDNRWVNEADNLRPISQERPQLEVISHARSREGTGSGRFQ